MIHPHTELRHINNDIGYGVVATKFIPQGTITWVLDKFDREFTPREFDKLDSHYKEILDTYSFCNSAGNLVLCWDHGRFVNHSFNSNCLTTAYDFEVAIRDIHPGEQITDDYGYLNISRPFRAVDEGTRRKTVYPDDLLRYHKVWDKKLSKVFPIIPTLDQPLYHLLSDKVAEEVKRVAGGEKAMISILKNYYSNGRDAR